MQCPQSGSGGCTGGSCTCNDLVDGSYIPLINWGIGVYTVITNLLILNMIIADFKYFFKLRFTSKSH